MAKMTPAKRKEMETLIYTVFDKLDPTGVNVTKYRNMFKDMSDTQFDNFFKRLFENEDAYLLLDVVDYENSLSLDNVEAAAKVLGVPLFENVVMPHVNMDTDRPVVTKRPVPVGYLHIKRMQQILSKKNSASTEIGERAALTGQVVGKDKNSRESDTENFALMTLDTKDIIRELMGPRADDMVMKTQMYSEISKKGYVALDELTDDINNKTTLNTVNAFLLGMGIDSDLVQSSLNLL